MKVKKGKADVALVRLFANRAAWDVWLEKNHRKHQGLWLRLAKKGSGIRSVTYGEALEVALTYGWIDGQKKPDSELAWLQRFVPRGQRSIWSKINREKALALIASGGMKAAGLEAVEFARKSGRWESAYDSPKGAEVPKDFHAALDASPRAREFFQGFDRANRYAVLFRIQTVKKAETRARKIVEFVAMLERGERIHEPRKARAVKLKVSTG
ncbi:MAG: YdeI/OmpD-associated family protein [Candidatus Sulfotelmatobacter sp.]